MVGSQQGQDVTPAVIDACRRGDRQAFRVLYEAARLTGHQDQVARKARGLEAALVEHRARAIAHPHAVYRL
jgi:hypothetical protein